MDIESTCTNRNLPSRIPFGGRNPVLQLAGGGPFTLRCHTKPTSPLRPPLGQGLRWRVVSHLALNHLSLVDNEQGAMALRELLNLYDFRGDEVTATTVTGLLNVNSAPMLGRVPGDRSGAMCRGTSITLEFDEEKYSGGNLFLVACVLERFMAMYSNINSFTQVTAKSNRRQGILHRWPIRAGMQNLV
jgi:type VI secretion system protein ImpG